MSLTPDSQFGHYRIGEVIGEGGMGQVYLATDTSLDRQVAIKVLPESFAEDADRVTRFEREAKTLASLNHPNIAQIHGLEKRDGITAIVMELVEGMTLADHLIGGPLPADEALRIAKQIINGLEAAHERGIVHRDLKPANIKVKADGSVKILDFGIAKPIDIMGSSKRGVTPTMVTPAVTETGIIMGTAAYMSPEQAQGKFVDQRTDIWAFGCVLFEMLTGQPAFSGENVMLTLAKILANETDLASIPGTISPAVRHTLELCLQKDPAKRLHHIGDVRLGMAGALDSLPHAKSGRKAKTSWWLPLTTAVAASALTAAVFLNLPTETEQPEQVAAQVRRSSQTLPANQALTSPFVRSVALSEDDQKVVYAANGALYVRDTNELEPRIVAGTEGENAITPYFSPDGRWIGYIQAGAGIKRVSVEGGTPLPVTQDFPFGGFTWADNDSILYSNVNLIYRVSANGGQPELLVEEENGFTTSSPKFLPGGRFVLYQRNPVGGGNEEVTIHDLESGERTILFPGALPDFHPAGYIFYFEDTLGLLARAFDPATLEYGSPIAMVNDIYRAQGGNGSPQLNISNKGALLYVQGTVSTNGNDFLGLGNEREMTRRLNVTQDNYNWPSVSPDGTQVAVQGNQQIWIYKLDGSSEIRQLTRDGTNINPTWSPDGQYIAYSSDRDGTQRIWQQRADGSGVAEPLTDGNPGQPQNLPVWAPDGRLAYNAPNEGGEADIWIVSLPLGEPEVLIGGTGNQIMPVFSADGRAVAYASNESGTIEIFVAPFPPDGSSTRVSPPGVVGIFPFWSKQGSTLYYSYAGNNGANTGAVDISIPGFGISNRRQLPYVGNTSGRRIDSMPSAGELFLALPAAQNYLESGENAAQELIFVENWLEEVKQRVPPLR